MLLAALLLAPLASVPPAPPIPLEPARRAFEETRLASAEDGGKLWGKPLYGPMMFVDPKSHFVVTNVADAPGTLHLADGVFTGVLPQSAVVSNTAFDWHATRWTMVMWPAVGQTIVQRRRLLLHESFHRIQEEVGFPSTNPANSHLDTVDGRYWLQLELRALASALRASGEARATAIGDAALFRAARRAAAKEGAADDERALENNEGLAEYTGFALRGTGDEETRLAVARRLETLDANTSFVRSFAYQTGPAYGLLLDGATAIWRKSYRKSDDLCATLLAAAKLTQPPLADAAARAATYGGAALRTSEEQRDAQQRARIAAYRKQLVDGPVVELPMQSADFSFDPNDVVAIDGVGNVYPDLNASGDWGTLAATRGVLIRSDFSRLVVAAPPGMDAHTRKGDGWTLTLTSPWIVTRGSRDGDWRVSLTP